MTRSTSIIVFFAPLAACLDQGFALRTIEAAGSDIPVIEVTPTVLDFGSFRPGETAIQTFSVRNVGPDASMLEVTDILIEGVSGSFTILTSAEDLSFFLPGGGENDIEVAFTPEVADWQTTEAVVVSNDRERNRVMVDLLGEGLVPELEISPDPLDLGVTLVGCDEDRDISLTNVGNDDLVLRSITHTGGHFLLTNSNILPLVLAPDQSTLVNVKYTPVAEGLELGMLAVTSNEPMGTRLSDQTGEGRYGETHQDTFVIPVSPPADILFFVDQSSSMRDDADALAGNFSSFISALSTYTTDWHIMVVNDDDGCNNSGVLTYASLDYESQFTDAVSRGGGDYTEAGLITTSRAIDQTDLGECNQKFLRDGAILHIIMVSDEAEQSPLPWDTYVNQVIAKRGDASLVKFSAVAGDYPDGCETHDNSADFGAGYLEAASSTGGEFLSICSDWATSVEILASASVERFTFDLTRAPVIDTITVSVNGLTIPVGWSYQSSTNSVVFDDSNRPRNGDEVIVDYVVRASCG